MSGRRRESGVKDQNLWRTESENGGGFPSDVQTISGEGNEPTGPIPIEAVNVGYSAIAMASSPAQQERPVALSLVQEGIGENSNDGSFVGPVTPQRLPDQAPENTIGTPLTPLANLKVLIAAASSALEREKENAAMKENMPGDITEEASGRKMKSLALLCKKFLSIVESDVGTGSEFSLDMMAQSLGTNRRRIYDIINVMEALEMIVKQSKNWYTWLGRASLIQTLAKLRAMALDDQDFQSLFQTEEADKENYVPGVATGNKKPPDRRISLESLSSTGCPPLVSSVSLPEGLAERGEHGGGKEEAEERCLFGDADGRGGPGRWDKSLGVLCQKFVMLFLVSPNHEMTLECAGSILMPDEDTGNPFASMNVPTISKSKVRRLYDIANVLTTLGLIKKKTFMAPNHRKMPGYTWCGPGLSEIESVSVCRRNEFGMGSLYPKKKGGITLTRKPSFGNRPFLHQYEVKSKDVSTSTPNTPTKAKEGGFRRSLSFGAPVAPKLPPCVVARPLSQRQLDYMHEVKEFEAEMQKHSYRYPHASVFHEFIQKYQSTLEQAASTGRTILPKPLAASNLANIAASANPTGRFNPVDLVTTLLSASSPPQAEGSYRTFPVVSSSPELPAHMMSLSSTPLPRSSSSVNSSPSTGFVSLSQSGSISGVSPNQVLPADATTIAATICAAISSGLSPTATSKSSKQYRKILPAPMKDSTDISPQQQQQAGECFVSTSIPLSYSNIPPSSSTTPVHIHGHGDPLPPTLDSENDSPLLFPSGKSCIGPLTTSPAESALTPEGSQSSSASHTTPGDACQVAVSDTYVRACTMHSDVVSPSETTVERTLSLSTSSTTKPTATQSTLPKPVGILHVPLHGTTTNRAEARSRFALKNIESELNVKLGTATSGDSACDTPLHATCGILRSPPTASSARSFISVEEFLMTQRSRKVTDTSASKSHQDVPLSHKQSGTSLQLSPPSGVQPLPFSSGFSKQPVAVQPLSALSLMVNQTPIPSACEHSRAQGGVQATPQVVSGNLSRFGIVNPNLFLTNPSPFIAFQSPIFANSGAVYPVNSSFVLPPVSALLGQRINAPPPVPMATSANDPHTGISPPKRPRLE